MITSTIPVASLNNEDLIARTVDVVRRSCVCEADLLVHLGEIDGRKLYLDRAFPSMFAFCVGELGFSEDAACNRIAVARAARQWPAVIEAVRERRIHLTGLRLLAPHLTEANHRDVLARAAGKSRREIEELVAELAPRPAVPALIRRLPDRPLAFPATVVEPRTAAEPATAAKPATVTGPATIASCAPALLGDRNRRQRPVIVPLAAETFKIQFTASRPFRDKLREAQDLLRHRFPGGDLEKILGAALELLVDRVKKERFAVGCKARPKPPREAGDPRKPGDPRKGGAPSRHVPAAMKRAVHERDRGRCAFVGEGGRRCAANAALEFDHVDGFARTAVHAVDKLRLLCRAHNQYAAERMYGRSFMENARAARRHAIRPGTDSQVRLF